MAERRNADRRIAKEATAGYGDYWGAVEAAFNYLVNPPARMLIRRFALPDWRQTSKSFYWNGEPETDEQQPYHVEAREQSRRTMLGGLAVARTLTVAHHVGGHVGLTGLAVDVDREIVQSVDMRTVPAGMYLGGERIDDLFERARMDTATTVPANKEHYRLLYQALHDGVQFKASVSAQRGPQQQ